MIIMMFVFVNLQCACSGFVYGNWASATIQGNDHVIRQAVRHRMLLIDGWPSFIPLRFWFWVSVTCLQLLIWLFQPPTSMANRYRIKTELLCISTSSFSFWRTVYMVLCAHWWKCPHVLDFSDLSVQPFSALSVDYFCQWKKKNKDRSIANEGL